MAGAASDTVTDHPLDKANFALVQGLRGLAAFWVVLFHAAEGKHIEQLRAIVPRPIFATVFDAGHYGVAVFFALSGFVIAHSLRAADVTPAYAGRFALRRSIRLDPPYWAAIGLVLATQVGESMVRATPLPSFSGGQIAAHLFYLQDILGYPTINAVFWTLCYEIQFYLFFVLSLMVSRAVQNRLGFAGTGAALRITLFAVALAGAMGAFSSVHSGVFLHLWYAFFAGVLAYWAARGSRFALWGLLAILGVLLFRSGSVPIGIGLGSTLTAILLYLASKTRWLIEGLRVRPFQWLGAISYSLYLTHNPLTGAGFYLASKFGGGVATQTVQLFLVLTLCLIGAYCFWWLMERPSHNLAKRLSLKSKTESGKASYAL